MFLLLHSTHYLGTDSHITSIIQVDIIIRLSEEVRAIDDL